LTAPRAYGRILVQYILLIVTALIFVVPLFWVFSASLKDLREIYTFPPVWIPTEPKFSNYSEAWDSAPFGRFYLNTIITTFFGVALEVVNAVLTAYALVFLRFPGKNLVFIVMLAALMVPIHVTILPNFLTIASLGWVNTYQGIILPGASVAFGAFLLRQHFLTLPREIPEAARLDGASHLQILWYVILPISRPMLVTVALVSVVTKWNDFLWPLISTNSENMRTLPIGLVPLQRGGCEPVGPYYGGYDLRHSARLAALLAVAEAHSLGAYLGGYQRLRGGVRS
jgi:sn-glycerol 3-phosphate transport system permease protein